MDTSMKCRSRLLLRLERSCKSRAVIFLSSRTACKMKQSFRLIRTLECVSVICHERNSCRIRTCWVLSAGLWSALPIEIRSTCEVLKWWLSGDERKTPVTTLVEVRSFPMDSWPQWEKLLVDMVWKISLLGTVNNIWLRLIPYQAPVSWDHTEVSRADSQQCQRATSGEETNVEQREKYGDLSRCYFSIGETEIGDTFRKNDTHKSMEIWLGECSEVQRVSVMTFDSCSQWSTDLSYWQE